MNQAYQTIFKENKLTIGIFLPIESYSGAVPLMQDQVRLVQKAEAYGFSAIWARDIPLHDPNFGDVGQMHDPFIFLTHLAAQTKTIGLAIGSIILPFRHPLNLAKQIISLNELSNGRLALGIATGDRAIEYAAYGLDYSTRGERFQESLSYIKNLIDNKTNTINSPLGYINNAELLPKITKGKVPMMVTGHSQQSLEWIAEHSDAWIYYPRGLQQLAKSIKQWRTLTKERGTIFKPFVQSLYIDLSRDPDFKPVPIHLGYKLGANYLIEILKDYQEVGLNHVILNLKYGSRDAEDVLDELGGKVLPFFKEIE